MSTQVDDLQIKLTGDAKNAESEIDKIISKVSTLESKVSSFGKGNGSRSMTGFASGAKKSVADLESYVSHTVDKIEKNLTKEFKLKFTSEFQQAAFKNNIQSMVSGYAKMGKLTGQGKEDAAIGAYESTIESVKSLYHTIRDISELNLSDIGKPLGDFVEYIRSFEKIAVGSEFFNSNHGGLSGHAIGRFTVSEGANLDRMWPELVSRFPFLDSKAAGADQALAVNAALKQHNGNVDTSANRDLIQKTAIETINNLMHEISNAMENAYKTASVRLKELRLTEKGQTGKDYAEKGGKFDTAERIQTELDKLQQKLYNAKNDLQLIGDVGSAAFEKTAYKVITLENKIESLNAAKTALENQPTKYGQDIEDAVARMKAREAATEGAAKATEELNAAMEASGVGYKNYEGAEQQFNELYTAAKNAIRGTKEFQNAFNAMGTKLTAIKENPLVKMNFLKPREEFKELQGEISKTQKKYNDLTNAMKRGLETNKDFAKTTTFEKMKYDIKQTQDDLEGLNGALKEMGNGTHYVDVKQIFSTIKDAAVDTVRIVKKATEAFVKFLEVIGSPIDMAFKGMTNAIKSFDLANTRLVKSLNRTIRMLTLMVTRMALRAVINETKTSFGELIQFSDKVADAYNKIRNAIKYLADTFAALISPLLISGQNFRNLGEIFDAVADKIVNLANKLNQLLAALTGKSTWIKANKQQKNYAASLDDTTKKQKKLNKQLAAFDELNNLTTTETGGNNPTNTGTGGSQFSEQPIDPKWLKFADWLKNMWKKGDGTELGNWLADKIIEALKKIPWGKIQNFARRLGSFLATTLNGLFRREDLAKEIGNALASAVNTGLIFAEEFIKKFDFAAFGNFIGIAISEAIKGIHWKRFLDACLALGKGIATAINNLLSTGVLRQIGYAIANLLLGAINFAFGLVTEIDWDLLGKELNAGIQKFFSTMSATDKETGLNGWQKLGQTLSDIVKGALTAINKVLGDPETRGMIGSAIKDFFDSFDYPGIKESIKELAINLVKLFGQSFFSAMQSGNFREALGDIGKVFRTILVLKLVKSIASFGTSVLSTALGVWLGKAIMSGAAAAAVKSAGVAIMEMFTTMAAGAKTAALAVGGAMKTAVAAIGSAVTSITMFMTADIGTLLAAGGTTAGAAMGTAIVGGAAAALAGAEFGKKVVGPAMFPEDAELYEHYSGIKGTFALIKDTVVTFSEETSDFLGGIIDKIGDKVKNSNSTLGQAIGIFGQGVVDGVKQKFDYVKGVFTGGFDFIIQDTKDSVNAMINQVKTLFQAIGIVLKGGWEGVKNTFTNIKNFIVSVIQALSDLLTQFGQKMRDTFNDSSLGKAAAIAGKVVSFIRGNAGGGIYAGGRWQPIQGYASGGTPKSAEMFMARENGAPELVGKIGSHTAVANNDQIVASIADGVYRAVKSAMGSGGGGTQTVQVEVIPDKDNLFNVIRKQGNDYQRRTGNPVWA